MNISSPYHSIGFFGPARTSPVAHQEPTRDSVLEEVQRQDDEKLRKIFIAIADLIRTPSDQAQIKAVHAIENVAQKGMHLYPLGNFFILFSEWNVSRLVVHGFVPHVVILLKSKFVDVQEIACRVIATLLKYGTTLSTYHINPHITIVDFTQSFIQNHGIVAILDLLVGPDDGVRLVAAKALTVAAYTSPELTRGDLYARGSANLLASMLRVDNEFVRFYLKILFLFIDKIFLCRVQTAWALSQILTPNHPLTDAFAAASGVAHLCSLLVSSGGSPACELRSLGALLSLLPSPSVRTTLPSSVPKKIASLLSSPQLPVRTLALQAAQLLVQDREMLPVLLEGHGLAGALIAFIQVSFVIEGPLLLTCSPLSPPIHFYSKHLNY